MADERPSWDACLHARHLARAIDRSHHWFYDPEQIEHHLRKVADELGFDVVKRGEG